jgi:serralysin
MDISDYGVCVNSLTPRREQTPPILNQQETPRAAAETALLWGERDRKLRVHFLDGPDSFHDAVRQTAPQWCAAVQMAGGELSFDFRPTGTPDITVNFAPIKGQYGIYNSFIGQASRGRVPSMNLTFPPGTSDPAVLRRYILHEFGHALGLIHEHQSPGRDFAWNERAVIDWFRQYLGWGEQMVRQQVLEPYLTQTTTNTAFDPRSVMLYPIYPGWASTGLVTGWNDDLSETDKRLIARLYGPGGV